MAAMSGRRRRAALVGVVAASVIASCQPSGTPDATVEEASREGVASGQVSTVVRGILVLGPEVRSIKPCDEDRELWVVPIGDVTAAYESLSREPYAPVFVELEGEVGPAPESGFGAEYDQQLAVSALRRASPAEEGFGCQEDVSAFAFRASGVEPFWGVQVREASIVFSTPEIPETVFESVEPAFFGGGWVYETVAAGPEPITLRLELTPERCSDSMVGAIYSWSARVDIGGQIRQGCAWEGALAPGP
jgi:putative lipoprotein